MLKDLIKMASKLDALGLSREADIIDSLIKKFAGPPLIDVGEWETGDADVKLTDIELHEGKEGRRGIGWSLSSKEVDTAKWIMEKSPGDWVFVIPDNVYKIEEKIRSASFEKWLKKKMYGAGYYIFVVGAAPFKGEHKDPQWVVHDLVGHSAGNKFIRYNTSFAEIDFKSAIGKIWGLLPHELQNAEELFDRVFDISAGIIFGAVTLEKTLEDIKSLRTDDMENLKKSITLMFDSAQSWLGDQKWLDIGGNKVSIIKPWE